MTPPPAPVHSLLAMPVAEAAEWLGRQHAADLSAAIATAQVQGMPAAAMEPGRLARGFRHLLLAWCSQGRRIPGHGPVVTGDDRDALWAVAARRPLSPGSPAEGERGATLLSEMAWSLACEQSPGWRDPPGVREELAHLVFTRLVQRTSRLLLGAMRKQFGRDLQWVEDVVMTGCAEAFRYYWSRAARTRFLVTSKISTLLHATIVRAGRRQIAEGAAERGIGQAGDEDGDAGDALDQLPGRPTDIDAFIVRDAFRHCLGKLTGRQRTVVEGRLVDGKSNLEIAADLGVTPPATTMQYQQALRNLMECMRAQGVER